MYEVRSPLYPAKPERYGRLSSTNPALRLDPPGVVCRGPTDIDSDAGSLSDGKLPEKDEQGRSSILQAVTMLDPQRYFWVLNNTCFGPFCDKSSRHRVGFMSSVGCSRLAGVPGVPSAGDTVRNSAPLGH